MSNVAVEKPDWSSVWQPTGAAAMIAGALATECPIPFTGFATVTVAIMLCRRTVVTIAGVRAGLRLFGHPADGQAVAGEAALNIGALALAAA